MPSWIAPPPAHLIPQNGYKLAIRSGGFRSMLQALIAPVNMRLDPAQERGVLVNSQPGYCKIVLNGPLSERWVDYLGDMLLCVEVEQGQIRTNTLIGRPPDLAAYIGTLNAIANLGFTVVATEYRQAAPAT